MKKLVITYIFIVLSMLYISVDSISAEDKITLLRNQIFAMEKQKSQLETEKQPFVNQGEELSYKIEELKAQSGSGLGIIGRYKLSQNLRKAQNLSNKIQSIDKKIYDLDNQIKEKKVLLDKEYEYQINSLVKMLNGSSNVDEKVTEKQESSKEASSSVPQFGYSISNIGDRKAILAKIKEYQTARDQLEVTKSLNLERLYITDSIEIKNYDSPKEIREKADLINDLVNKTSTRISILDSRIIKLKGELKTRKKLDEFADEISFFNERVARGEIASKSATGVLGATDKDNAGKKTDSPTTETTTVTRSFTDNKSSEQPDSALPSTPATQPALSVKVMKSNGVPVDLSEIPQNRIEGELKTLEKQKQELKKELAVLNEKASTFRKKADELEKSGKTGETQSARPRKQSSGNKGSKDKAQKKP